MVETRRQWQRRRANERMMQRQWPKRYKPTDSSHRHRLKDRQPKTVKVVSYKRRA